MVQLLYVTGMRLMELLRLRVMDVDFARNQIVVRVARVTRVTRIGCDCCTKRMCGKGSGGVSAGNLGEPFGVFMKLLKFDW